MGTRDNPPHELPWASQLFTKMLKDSTHRFYNPSQVVSWDETTRVGELSRLGR